MKGGWHGAGLSDVCEENTMMTFINRIKTALQNHARYIATRNEIARLPMDVALDIGIFPGDADKIARKAVYS